ncbi:MAG: endonuclease/exonuclease/phosphatase family protein [Oscillospiraceae bacterium]|nr:endonuclease/exonuclease/phosphatase family protein [Oscillospiraceae bacterium]
MKVLYLNCATRLATSKGETPQRIWLKQFVCDNEIDIVCLAESSNCNFNDVLPDIYKNENCWYPTDTFLAKRGYKMNICSKLDVIFKAINYSVSHDLIDGDYEKVLMDYGYGTLVSMRFNDIEMVSVHIQYPQHKYQSPYYIYYELGLHTLYNYMQQKRPIAVFGDFNNYSGDTSFDKLKTIYRDANADPDAFSYINASSNTKFLLDHTFTISDTLKMEYVDTLQHGFDHKGMLITLQ